ncbi:Crp/Fnr family transcriptional regulator [Lactobacillaceae bacterium Scapto_B20]
MKHHDPKQCVSKVPIFSELDPAELSQVSKLVHHQHLKRGNLLYQLSETNDSLYIVHHGQLKMYRLLKNGREQLIRILTPGNFTGEWSLFQPNHPHNNYVEAISDVAICKISRTDMIELLKQNPQISVQILSQMSKRLEQSEDQTATLANGSIISRIAMYLIDLNNALSNDNCVELPISRKELASYLGTTPESITRNLNKLTNLKLIHNTTKRKIEIIDLDRLKAIK